MIRTVFLLACVSLLGGCISQDMRGSSDICEVHHVHMAVMSVRASECPVVPAPGYAEAHDKLFPHSVPSNYLQSKWPWRMAVYYVCTNCVEAEKEWLKNRTNAPAN